MLDEAKGELLKDRQLWLKLPPSRRASLLKAVQASALPDQGVEPRAKLAELRLLRQLDKTNKKKQAKRKFRHLCSALGPAAAAGTLVPSAGKNTKKNQAIRERRTRGLPWLGVSSRVARKPRQKPQPRPSWPLAHRLPCRGLQLRLLLPAHPRPLAHHR